MFKFIVILIRFPFWLFARVLLLPKFRFPLVPRKWRKAKDNKAFDAKMRKKQRAADKSHNQMVDSYINQARDNIKTLSADRIGNAGRIQEQRKRIAELMRSKK